jgi:hypothetical protein
MSDLTNFFHAPNALYLDEKRSRERLADLELKHGADRIETATELNILAQILQQSGKRAEAEITRKRVTRIILRQYSNSLSRTL